jgi:serine/threonine protein kinase
MHAESNSRTLAEEDDSAVDLTSVSTATHLVGTTPPLTPVLDMAPGGELAPGDRLGQYRLIRRLGVGGMGIVYEAEDEWLGRRVALKALRGDLPGAEVARERFLREARAMAAVEHENVVTIYQVAEVAGRPYMTMQLLAGETLETRLARAQRLAPAEAARVGREVAAGLAAAHAKGLVHRDIKPSNVWLEAGTGRVKLLDFGLALAREQSHPTQPGDVRSGLTQPGFVIGTPAFMSPEQARGQVLDGRSDLFSLGIILYLMTTGERPFDGPTALAVMRNLEMHQPARVNVKRPDVPAAFSNLIMELLAKDPKDRPPSADVVAVRLARPEVTRPTHLPVAPPASLVRPPAPALSAAGGRETSPPPPRPTARLVRVGFLSVIAVLSLGAFWYFDWSNYGRLEIDPVVPDAEVQIRQGGQLRFVSLADRTFDLRPGTYELVLLRPPTDYKLTRTTVEVGRGGRETVRVVRDRP